MLEHLVGSSSWWRLGNFIHTYTVNLLTSTGKMKLFEACYLFVPKNDHWVCEGVMI